VSLTVPDDGGPFPVQPDQQGTENAAEVEQRLAALADQMARLIENAPRPERAMLHDYAVSLLRETASGTEISDSTDADVVEHGAAASGPRSQGATLLGYGFLLLPASAVLLLVFPPVGGMLLLTGLCMMCGGLGTAVIGRFAPSAWRRG